ncbi:MAG: Abi-alpha family protein [Novosphingobium sp.]|uniref:Abi-alpha family protein n=1 Tax=Novosphingobium sp. TaxID=1874826 RepID=UPI003C7D4482
MVEPLTTTAILGAGWFASKVLGPPADALGDQLKIYVGDKLQRIAGKAQAKADPAKVTPLSPAFFYNFCQKAAFSEDSEEIINMWASLLASASENQTYRHAIFADILSRIGSEEAKFLAKTCQFYHLENSDAWKKQELRKHLFDDVKEKFPWRDDNSRDDAQDHLQKLFNYRSDWPVIVKSAMWPYKDGAVRGVATTSIVMQSDYDPFAIDVLCRERIFEFFDFDFIPGWVSPQLDGFYLTHLGAQFVQACERKDR